MPRITYKKISVHQFEQFLVAASLIFDSDDHWLEPWGFRLAQEFEDTESERKPLIPLEIMDFCEIIYPVLPLIGYLAPRNRLSRSYHFFTSQAALLRP